MVKINIQDEKKDLMDDISFIVSVFKGFIDTVDGNTESVVILGNVDGFLEQISTHVYLDEKVISESKQLFESKLSVQKDTITQECSAYGFEENIRESFEECRDLANDLRKLAELKNGSEQTTLMESANFINELWIKLIFLGRRLDNLGVANGESHE